MLPALFTSLAACSRAPQSADAPQASPSAATESAAPSSAQDERAPKAKKRERQPIDPATTGTIRGEIKFEGTPPERKEMAVGNTAGCEHHPVPPLTEDVIVSDGHLQNVFVYIKSGLDDWILPAAPSTKVELDQQGCMYRPRVIGMQLGQTLSVKNADPATHNVHARPERNEGFNRSQAPGGANVDWTATKAEVMIPMGCDIHPWMKAYVGVRDHPWFAVSGADGRFVLQGVPPGDYVIEAWHEKYGRKTGNLHLDAHGSADIALAFSAK